MKKPRQDLEDLEEELEFLEGNVAAWKEPRWAFHRAYSVLRDQARIIEILRIFRDHSHKRKSQRQLRLQNENVKKS